MKKIIAGITPIALIFLLLSNTGCNSNETKRSASGRKIAERDTSINRTNASNPHFLDSAALEKFITEQSLNDTLADGMRSFYNNRNFQFAWIGDDGLTEQALLFKSMYDFGNDSSNARKKLDRQLDALTTENALRPATHLKTELMLTWRFVQYTDNVFSTEEERNKVLETFMPRKKMQVQEIARLVLEENEMPTEAFSKLAGKIERYAAIVANGGWNKVASINDIPGIKKRLAVSGEYTGKDSTAEMNASLKEAILLFQTTHGFDASGKLNEEQLKEMNVPAEKRLETLLVNLERMRWMPEYAKGRSVRVNIPEFRLHARDGKDSVFTMNVVVGKEANGTILFASTLSNVVFSPYWNVPRSIVKNEILPAIEKNRDYLKEKNMEITGEENGLPVVRQLPGNGNALGKVKFLFPNAFNIYFHDSPEKHLFNKEDRAYSHGCIRLADPAKMARFCLEGMKEWDDKKISEAMNSGEEQYVKIKHPVQVQIAYYTAWVDERGMLHFRNDIYGHDAESATHLFL
ncbi:MAG: L,D-transpeptidase family protein [Chitinophagaceae bacterium]